MNMLFSRFAIISLFICIYGCDNNDTDNKPDPVSEDITEANSIWRLSEPFGRYGIYLELGSNSAIEYKTIHAGALCRESSTIDTWTVLYGDPEMDDVIGIEYVNELGVTVTVEINRQPNNVFEYHPLCEDAATWNGIYKQNGSVVSPDYYWEINVPNTIGYFWSDINGCYDSIELTEWYMSALYLGPGELVFDAVYEIQGMSYTAYLEKIYDNNTEINPICSIN
ncbi:hypothetical protein [Kaarinaea lacus]